MRLLKVAKWDNLFVSPEKENKYRICGRGVPVNMHLSHLTKWSFVSFFQSINFCLLTQTDRELLRIISLQDHHKVHSNAMIQKSKRQGAERRNMPAVCCGSICNSSWCRDCFHTFLGEILQFNPRRGSAERLRDLLIVLVLLDLISRSGGKQCHATVLQVDYSLSWLQFASYGEGHWSNRSTSSH